MSREKSLRLEDMERVVAAQVADSGKTPKPGHPDHDDNPTRLPNWFLRLPRRIPVPRTEIIRAAVSLDFIGMLDGDKEATARFHATADAVIAAADRIGWPCFLRTDMTSHKHGWKETCLLAIRDRKRVVQQLGNIVEAAECGGCEWSNAVVVRELLPTEPAFHAFYGDMPVTKERRYFVADGRVVCHHPYWPAHAIDGHAPSARGWRKALAALNREPQSEVRVLGDMSRRVSRKLPGAWSVDWLWTERGWFLIDMAEAHSSFHWPHCRSALAPVRP